MVNFHKKHQTFSFLCLVSAETSKYESIFFCRETLLGSRNKIERTRLNLTYLFIERFTAVNQPKCYVFLYNQYFGLAKTILAANLLTAEQFRINL